MSVEFDSDYDQAAIVQAHLATRGDRRGAEDQAAVIDDERRTTPIAVQDAAEHQLADWTNLPCPAGGFTVEAFFDPQPNDGSRNLDIDPGDGWQGYEIVRLVDLALPDGIMLESDGISLGDGRDAVRIADPGTYPFYMAISVHDDRRTPALGQLVFDPAAVPVRWVDDDRLGFGTDGGTGWLGSPNSAVLAPTNGGDLANAAWSMVSEELGDINRTSDEYCTVWERSDGSNFVHYRSGSGEFFPAASGYDANDNLVAVTWFYGTGPWVLAGIPGTPPAQVQQRYAAN